MALQAMRRKGLQFLDLPFKPIPRFFPEDEFVLKAGLEPKSCNHEGEGVSSSGEEGSTFRGGQHADEFGSQGVCRTSEGESSNARIASSKEASCSPRLLTASIRGSFKEMEAVFTIPYSSPAPLPVGRGGASCMTSAFHQGVLGDPMRLLGSVRAYNVERWANEPARAPGNQEEQDAEGACAYVKGAPHYLLASDLVRYLAEFNVDESRVHPVYEENFRPHGWYIDFPTQADFVAADRKTYDYVLGARALRIEKRPRHTMEESIRRDEMQKWRGKSVVISHLPAEVDEATLERFFHGYSIAGNGIKIFRQTFERRTNDPDPEPLVEVRAVVKFTTGLEAMRAWREKHLDIVQRRSVRLALVK